MLLCLQFCFEALPTPGLCSSPLSRSLIMAIYLIVVGDVLVGGGGSPGLLSEAAGSRHVVLAVVCLLLLPAVLPRTPRSMTGPAALGVGAIGKRL